jgi:rhodanese-related sulfurtransferase
MPKFVIHDALWLMCSIMRKATLVLIMGFSFLNLFCQNNGFKSISVNEFSVFISDPEVTVVDVRTAEEHAQGYIPGTDFNIDVLEDGYEAEAIAKLPKDKPVALYCRSGNRSKTAAELLAKEGYEVYELATGFNGWIEAGYKVADPLLFVDTTHEGLSIYYPKFESIDLVCGSYSPVEDKNAVFCCAASFTGETLSVFKHSNVAGNHVSGGEYNNGYLCKHNTGAFVWYKGQWKFLLKEYSDELKKTAASSGMGFGQNMIIHDGIIQPLWRSNSFQYRSLCELDGKLCIIQSKESVPYRQYVDMLKAVGVKHAIYLDMGGWCHAWYRKFQHSDVSYINTSMHKYYTNWLTFYIQ